MENADLKNKMEKLGSLETAILSAHLKFFKGIPDVRYRTEAEDSILYDTVIHYFTCKS